MNSEFPLIHPSFQLNGTHFEVPELKDVAYSLIKEGEPFEQRIGDFLFDWLSDQDTILVTTSGATGIPKRIFLKKQHMANSARATAAFLDLQEGDSALLCLPADYIAGKMMLVRALVLGLSLEMVEPSSDPLWRTLKSYDLTAMVPMQVQKSLSKLDQFGTLLIGGAPISSSLGASIEQLNCRVFETYGMTETCSHVALRRLNGDGVSSDGVNPFRGLPGVTFSQDERDCLVIEAPELASQPVKTNDLIQLLSENEFEWLGRLDHIINSGGIKLVPESIETKLNPVIAESFVLVGIPDEELGQALVLVLEADEMPEDVQERLDSLKTLDKYEHPKQIYHLKEFPRTESGKIKRKAVAEQVMATKRTS